MPRDGGPVPESSQGARGMVAAGRRASASPIHTQTKESCSTHRVGATRAVRGIRFWPGTTTQLPVVS